jgi:DNA polymerase-3 subunit delta
MSLTLIKGDDATLVAQSLAAVVKELVGAGDRSLMVEEVGEAQYAPDGGEPELTALVNAAHTPPFLTERRVVVGRHLAMFTRGEQVAGLIGWIESPLSTTDVVLVWEKGSNTQRLGAIPKTLKEALKSAGAREIDAAPSGRGRKMLLNEKLADASVRLDGSARSAIADHLGDDAGRVQAILESLVSAFGEGTRLSRSDVEPYLGQASDVPPWELTDAIDKGDIAVTLDKLHRMIRGGDRHPLQVMATLHGHYQRALALDGSGVADEKAAAAQLGMKGSTFPAKKALTLSRRLGTERTKRAIQLLAQADLDLRGASAMPAETVVEVLAARLARLSR